MKSKRYGEHLARLLMLLAALFFVGCADDSGNGDGGDTDMNEDGSSDGDTIQLDFGDMDCPSVADPNGDYDNDGLINAAEDKNGNCEVDAGETDLTNPDSDGDGKLDGDEDINGDGIYDPDKGETDPNNSDSDGDGVPDGEEPGNVICTRDLLDDVNLQSAQFAGANLALADGFAISNPTDAMTSGAAFSNPATNTYGLVVSKTPMSGSAEQENSQSLVDVAVGGNQPTVEFSRLFDAPAPEWGNVFFPLPDISGVRAQIAFNYGADSPNPGDATKDPAVLRDELLSAISGQTVTSGETGTACSNIKANWVAQLYPADSVFLTTIVLTCEDDLNNSQDLQFAFSDILSGTVIAPGTYRPTDFRCEDLEPQLEGGKVDFLWVIDTSGSMSDEQSNVAATAESFLQTLQSTDVDWRLGVTTTEAYGITGFVPPNAPGTADLAHDELVDLQTGLRGVGFLSAADTDAASLFSQYVTFDEGCTKTGVPDDSNVCGSGLEEGLESGLIVLNATSSDMRPDYQLRTDARTIVVWVSDEENQSIKLDDFFTPIPSTDSRWQPVVDSWVTRYNMANATGFAIVGDAGSGAGGICEELENSASAIVGAQHGETYIAVANATGGASGSICNSDLQGTIDAIIAAAIGLASSYQLTGYPISSTIRVAVDGEVIQRSRSQGWDYDADTNSIVFFGVSFDETSTISVAYLLWEDIGG